MAQYSVAKNVEDHLDVIEEFKLNIPSNRDVWNPPEGYKLEQDMYHHSRKGNTHGLHPVRVGTVEEHIVEFKSQYGGEMPVKQQWRAIAKAKSQWNFSGKGRNYKVYTTILWAKHPANEYENMTPERMLSTAHKLQIMGKPIPEPLQRRADKFGLDISLFGKKGDE